jgi:hypothetical protein
MRPAGFLFLLALLAAPAPASAQVVRGVVQEDGSRRPLAGATVQLLSQGGAAVATARTDSAGAFTLMVGRAGAYRLRLTHPSFVALDSLPLVLAAREAVQLELRMGRSAIPLEPLVVTARQEPRLAAFQERLQQPGGVGQFVRREQIESRPGAVRVTDLLRELPGLEIVTVPPRGGSDRDGPPPAGTSNETMPRVQMIAIRSGTAYCEPAIFIDGMQFRQVADSGIDDILHPGMLEGVEVYPRAAGLPQEFMVPNTCGAVAFWTRPGFGGRPVTWRRIVAAGGGFLAMVGLVKLAGL